MPKAMTARHLRHLSVNIHVSLARPLYNHSDHVILLQVMDSYHLPLMPIISDGLLFATIVEYRIEYDMLHPVGVVASSESLELSDRSRPMG
jgi:hypothetical protein